MTYVFTLVGVVFLILFLTKRDKNGSVLATGLKTLTSLLFIVTALVAMIETNKYGISFILIIIGLVCGMIGDILLDLKVYFKSLANTYNVSIKDHDYLTYFGMLSFGIGHIMYIISTFLLSDDLIKELIFSLIIGLALISLIMIISIKLLKMNYGKFLIPSICYGFLLSSFVVFMIFRIINHYSVGNLFLLLGSIFFILSDLVLSMTYFSKEEDYNKNGILNPESRFMISTNHILYYIAQFLIALSILFL
jgi:hypothetical protein